MRGQTYKDNSFTYFLNEINVTSIRAHSILVSFLWHFWGNSRYMRQPLRQTAAVAAASNRCPRGEMPWSGPPSVAAAAVVKTAAAATLSIAAATRSSPWRFLFFL